jgi:hypothetical protein
MITSAPVEVAEREHKLAVVEEFGAEFGELGGGGGRLRRRRRQ